MFGGLGSTSEQAFYTNMLVVMQIIKVVVLINLSICTRGEAIIFVFSLFVIVVEKMSKLSNCSSPLPDHKIADCVHVH